MKKTQHEFNKIIQIKSDEINDYVGYGQRDKNSYNHIADKSAIQLIPAPN